jgi:hypothetical protein
VAPPITNRLQQNVLTYKNAIEAKNSFDFELLSAKYAVFTGSQSSI